MLLLSGAQTALSNPALPSVILHFHSGKEIENTWTIARFKLRHKMYSLSGDHSIYCKKN